MDKKVVYPDFPALLLEELKNESINCKNYLLTKKN